MSEGTLYFETGPHREHTIRAEGSSDGDARVFIKRGGAVVREFLYPAYKVWNLAAHYDEIIDGEIERSDEGLRAAGTDLLGGCVMPREVSS